MKIHILQEARHDLQEGYRFYELQEMGLGSYFLTSLAADIDSLLFYSGIHPLFWGYHRMLAKRFPFAVYYRCDKENIYVWAVADCRKHPRALKNKLP